MRPILLFPSESGKVQGPSCPHQCREREGNFRKKCLFRMCHENATLSQVYNLRTLRQWCDCWIQKCINYKAFGFIHSVDICSSFFFFLSPDKKSSLVTLYFKHSSFSHFLGYYFVNPQLLLSKDKRHLLSFIQIRPRDCLNQTSP